MPFESTLTHLRAHRQAGADCTHCAHKLRDERLKAQQIGHVISVEVGHDQSDTSTRRGRGPVLHLRISGGFT